MYSMNKSGAIKSRAKLKVLSTSSIICYNRSARAAKVASESLHRFMRSQRPQQGALVPPNLSHHGAKAFLFSPVGPAIVILIEILQVHECNLSVFKLKNLVLVIKVQFCVILATDNRGGTQRQTVFMHANWYNIIIL